MSEIRLPRGLVALVDDEDYERVASFKWNVNNGGKYSHTHYAQRVDRSQGKKNAHTVMMHRFILGVTDRKIMVDHINRNGLDNRKDNLRACTNSQNQANGVMRRRNTSGFRGIRVLPSGNWLAQIKVDGKYRSVGVFRTKEEAAKAYDKAARQSFGEFAAVNFSEVKNG